MAGSCTHRRPARHQRGSGGGRGEITQVSEAMGSFGIFLESHARGLSRRQTQKEFHFWKVTLGQKCRRLLR